MVNRFKTIKCNDDVFQIQDRTVGRIDTFRLQPLVRNTLISGCPFILLTGTQNTTHHIIHATSRDFFNFASTPRMPCCINRVTRMNNNPSANNHKSGNAAVNQLLSPLTANAPRIGPSKVPRPPTAAQITISIELPGDISDGLMIPTCGTYKAPATLHNTADKVQTNNLNHNGL